MKKMTSFVTLAGVLGMAMAFQVSAEMKNMQPMEQKMEQQMEQKWNSKWNINGEHERCQADDG